MDNRNLLVKLLNQANWGKIGNNNLEVEMIAQAVFHEVDWSNIGFFSLHVVLNAVVLELSPLHSDELRAVAAQACKSLMRPNNFSHMLVSNLLSNDEIAILMLQNNTALIRGAFNQQHNPQSYKNLVKARDFFNC